MSRKLRDLFKKETKRKVSYEHDTFIGSYSNDYVLWLEDKLAYTTEHYAAFCIECDRRNIRPLEFMGFLEL